MTELWVDTDFGFDDLWALLLLGRYKARIAGISLVAGNAGLPQVTRNALGAFQAYGFDIPMWAGEDRSLTCDSVSAEHILGPRGMQSRGMYLPEVEAGTVRTGAVLALSEWLQSAAHLEPRKVLALGPLTNIAMLVRTAPQAAQNISRVIWMGGSNGPGNHTVAAEFNALADPEAVQIVADAGIPMDVVDLILWSTILLVSICGLLSLPVQTVPRVPLPPLWPRESALLILIVLTFLGVW